MILRFTGVLYEWRGPSPFHFVDLPESESSMVSDVRRILTYGWGVIPVAAVVGSTEWSTSLFPREGRYALPVRASVRSAESLRTGAELHVELRLHV